MIALASESLAYMVDPVTGRQVMADSSGEAGLGSRGLFVRAAQDLAWSPDGQSLAYTTVSGVIVVDVMTGAESLRSDLEGCDLTFGCYVGWSPDGASLAVTEFQKIHIIDVASGRTTPIATLRDVDPASPAWSPDGEWIVFAVRPRLYRVRPDGSDLTRVLTDEGLGPVDPTWTPGGTRIAFVSSEDPPGDGWNLVIVSVDPDGSDRRQIAHIGSCFCLGWWPPGLAWSPDGTQIAFVTLNFGIKVDADTRPDGGAKGGLFVATADGSEPRLLLSGVTGSPAWQSVP
ncbi:MAG TPA: hypothetical protein VFP66_09880 [Candidatus Limnocylindrales bacterium]|nr:hypothetical protein [Candidatus Limnocylindrales bacterium]